MVDYYFATLDCETGARATHERFDWLEQYEIIIIIIIMAIVRARPLWLLVWWQSLSFVSVDI